MSPTVLDTPCREWQGTRTPKGYGQRYIPGRNKVYVHRWVWEQINGPIPPGKEIMHLCDNPPCFRYDHLKIGTHADNTRDMAEKGRGYGHGLTKTHCPAGHPYDEANTFYKQTRKGYVNRICRTCAREAQRRRRTR
jgi:hypothetical protein